MQGKKNLILGLVGSLFFVQYLSINAEEVYEAWVARYNGPGNGSDEARTVTVDNSGNVYVTGASAGSGTSYDYATIKYSLVGDILWVRRYNGPGNFTDIARSIAVDHSGYVYVTGESRGSGPGSDFATIKYYPNGDTAWVRRYNGPTNFRDEAQAISIDDFGNVYVTGLSYFASLYDYATIKYYPNGDTAWLRRYYGPINGYDVARSIAVDDSGYVYVTGQSLGIGWDADYATIKYFPNGDTAWVRRYDGPDGLHDFALALTIDGSGNVYVTGWSENYNSDSLGTQSDYATIKYHPNGDTAWVRRYSGPADSIDEAQAIAVDGSGNVYVTGRSHDYNSDSSATQSDYATIKYLPDGNTAWVRRFNGPGDSEDGASAIALDDSGNVYVTGISYFDYTTIKYSPCRTAPDVDGDGNADPCDTVPSFIIPLS